MECRIITNEDELLTLVQPWRTLHDQIGKIPFCDFDSVLAWWDTIGKPSGVTLHIATGWREGKLVATLPLAVYKKRGLRLLRWVGHDVFYGPIQICKDEEDTRMIWEAALASGLYDFAEIKYIVPGSVEHSLLTKQKGSHTVYKDQMTWVTFDGKSSEQWQGTFSSKNKRKHKKHMEKLENKGPVSLEMYHCCDVIPSDMLNKMIAHKKAWCEANDKQSALFDDNGFLYKLINAAHVRHSLFITWLKCGEDVIGLWLCFSVRDIVYGYIIASDYEWGSFAPGILVTYKTLLWAADHGFNLFHLMEGKERYKMLYANHEQQIETIVFCQNIKGRMGLAVYDLQRLIKNYKNTSTQTNSGEESDK